MSTTITVLYEDNHIIAVVKPAGVLAQGDKTGDVTIMEQVKTYLKEKYKKPGNVFLGLVHRLDRPVYGIMLFAKTSKGASRLSEQFRSKTIEKTYQAIVCGNPRPQGAERSSHDGKPKQNGGVLTNNLGKDTKSMKAREFEDGVEANLYYELVRSNGKYSLLKIKIDSGKFHQIRAQLSLAGMPILGDVKYGGHKWQFTDDIALCATGLSFKTATEEKVVNLNLELPKEWISFVW